MDQLFSSCNPCITISISLKEGHPILQSYYLQTVLHLRTCHCCSYWFCLPHSSLTPSPYVLVVFPSLPYRFFSSRWLVRGSDYSWCFEFRVCYCCYLDQHTCWVPSAPSSLTVERSLVYQACASSILPPILAFLWSKLNTNLFSLPHIRGITFLPLDWVFAFLKDSKTICPPLKMNSHHSCPVTSALLFFSPFTVLKTDVLLFLCFSFPTLTLVYKLD